MVITKIKKAQLRLRLYYLLLRLDTGFQRGNKTSIRNFWYRYSYCSLQYAHRVNPSKLLRSSWDPLCLVSWDIPMPVLRMNAHRQFLELDTYFSYSAPPNLGIYPARSKPGDESGQQHNLIQGPRVNLLPAVKRSRSTGNNGLYQRN
jgi:hypothetical protein